MKNELLKIGPFTVYGYGLMIAIGILSAYILAEYRARKKNLLYEQILSLVLWCAVGGLISAKLLYWIVNWRYILAEPSFLLETIGDGFVVYGGVLGGILSGFIFCLRHRMRFLDYFDLVMPSVALAQSFGRIGCFLAGCCYGRESSGCLSVTFTESSFAPNGIPLIPTQLYASGLNFLHMLVLLWIARRTRSSGVVASCYLIFYSIGRFGLEFLRGDLERGSVGVLSTSQFLAVFTLGGGVLLLIFACMRRKRK